MMKTALNLCAVILLIFFSACNNPAQQDAEMSKEEKIKKELSVIDSLLHDKQFAEEMAMELEASYYKGIGEPVPAFLKRGEDSLMIDKSVREEKIATNLAGFYALECGLNYLCRKSNTTPLEWIEKIINKQADDSAQLILNRFANATWKAGQPFRGIDRIKRPNFISASSLSPEEVQKDYRQILAAATKLKSVLQPASKDEQFQQIRSLLQDKDFAYQLASNMDSSYYAGENKPAPPFISTDEINAVKKKSFKEEKIAMNIAGFYALECATNYLVTTKLQLPSSILRSLTDDSIPVDDKLLMASFANATWKAGQPFRSLDRITRDTFTPFNFLSEADIEKDLVQVRAAAKKLLSGLKQ